MLILENILNIDIDSAENKFIDDLFVARQNYYLEVLRTLLKQKYDSDYTTKGLDEYVEIYYSCIDENKIFQIDILKAKVSNLNSEILNSDFKDVLFDFSMMGEIV